MYKLALLVTVLYLASVQCSIKRKGAVVNTFHPTQNGTSQYNLTKKSYKGQDRSAVKKFLPLALLSRRRLGYKCEGSFRCDTSIKNGVRYDHCISIHQLCDGQRNCLNGADESFCPPECSGEGKVLCNDKKTCGKPCDGRVDCPDGGDEICPKACSCSDGMYQCPDGQCMNSKKVCDGIKHCMYGEDEIDCTQACKCSHESYRCIDGFTCVLPSKICDGNKDCPDGDDESSCPETCFCKPGQYICNMASDLTPLCIEKEDICEAAFDEEDCPNGEDEGSICNF